ncbi:class I SAM-dependent methyltransferase [Actinoplanes derwentensis]|uniref:Methyltransferase domain-containing protein n=1 Tax=Actinoplanes derwentensis TaxID=113562 RepID=A0A1H1W480_9ACTN|nr:class I SAM-dependent methyltransferase [Actinoplanes derwentensis]GID84047.1 methyltransferase type 12 [Actinoplanes derwentensis]SDS91947.1 Methyltransferase domain-containing protein [Actinoplanes derwentensis]
MSSPAADPAAAGPDGARGPDTGSAAASLVGGAADARRLAADSLAAGDPTGWFETLYAASRAGNAVVPWDVAEPSARLRALDLPPGAGRRALIVGCGPGRDAEHVAALGYTTTAFDISATAIDLARERHPGSPVTYTVADLLDPRPDWRHAFDLVLESNNVQALPTGIRAAAIPAIGGFVAPGGTLIVLAAATTRIDSDGSGPPWPLTRAEIDAFAIGGLRPVSVDQVNAAGTTLPTRWQAIYRR